MAFTKEKVKQLAFLTKVKLTDDEALAIVKDFETTMSWLDTLTKADTSGIEPLISVMEIMMPFNEDKVTDGNMAEIIVSNAPVKEGTFFVVPKVVE